MREAAGVARIVEKEAGGRGICVLGRRQGSQKCRLYSRAGRKESIPGFDIEYLG
jgi:hypothetical protein